MFKTFLTNDDYFTSSVPFLDRLGLRTAPCEILADASGNKNLGFRCYFPKTQQWCGKSWSETNWFKPKSEGGLGLMPANTYTLLRCLQSQQL